MVIPLLPRLAALLLCPGVLPAAVRPVASRLRVEIHHTWNGQDILPGTSAHTTAAGEILTLTRLDGLLSGIALQRADGSWMEGGDWFFYVSAGEARTRAIADGIPPGEYTALRFRVGLDPAMNASDPNRWPAGHPLHPDVNHLHWGWQGGYIFQAIEGHWQNAPGGPAGFSLHLANDANASTVTLPVAITGGVNATVTLTLDAAELFDGPQPVSLGRDGLSTHSREGDPLAAKLRDNISAAFSVQSVRTDLYQEIAPPPDAAPVKPVPGTRPWPLRISERLPRVTLPPDNPLTFEGVTLGRRLFHDTRLSGDGTQSCASCHDKAHAFSDPRPLSLGIAGRATRRHAMTLTNLAWSPALFWDGRAPALRQQVLEPIEHPDEMAARLPEVLARLSADPAMEREFSAAFGTPDITEERLALALEQFVLSLVSQESKFDRAARKLTTLTESESRGLQLFITESDPARNLRGADCFHCHGGNLFTNHQFHNNGLLLAPDDPGRQEITKNPADAGKFKTPTLRNIAVRAPYMHDGRFATLEEVIDHYDHGVVRSRTLDPNLAKHPASGLGLTAQDKQDLIAFLRTLTDDEFVSGE